MSNQELVDAGMKRMDETDQAIERSKQVSYRRNYVPLSLCYYMSISMVTSCSFQVVEQTLEVGTQTAANLKGQVIQSILLRFHINLMSTVLNNLKIVQTDQMGRVVNHLDTIQFSIKKASQLVKEIGRQVCNLI